MQLAVLLSLPFAVSAAHEDKEHAFTVGKNMQVFNEIYSYRSTPTRWWARP